VYFPKLYNGRDKTFFFASYETDFGPQSATNFAITVPTAAMSRGDFSAEPVTIRDPFANNQPFPGNQIPQERINNVSKLFLPFWPEPNAGVSNVVNRNYTEQKRGPFNKPHNAQFRVDHRISDNNTVFGRYLHNRQQNPGFESGLPGTLGFRQQLRVVKHFLLSDTHIFSPTLINEFRFGIAYDTNPRWATAVDGPEFLRTAGLENVTRDGTIPDIHQLPVVRFARGPGFQTIEVTRQRLYNESFTFQWQDTVSLIRGKHSFRMGFELNRHHFNDQYQPADLFGSYQFTDQYTGHNFADFLLGIPTSVSRAPFAERQGDRAMAYDLFIQDNYKATKSLTINFGLRYELHPAWGESSGRLSAFDKKTGSIVVPDEALPLVSDLFPTSVVPVIGHSEAGFPERLVDTDTNNLAPRVGFAWRPFGARTLVVRGAYGIFCEITAREPSIFGTPFRISEPSFTNPRDVNDSTFVQWPLAYPRVVRGAGVSLPTTLERGFRTPYSQNWNFTIEQEVIGMNVRVSYVGTGGRQIPYSFNINQPFPGPGLYVDKPRPFPALSAITETRNGASHTYNSLGFEVQRRFYRGLTFQTSLTFAKDLGDDEVVPENTFDRARERGRRGLQPFRRWVGFFIYELPFGKGKPFGGNVTGLASHLLGGWEISGSAALQDGQNETPLWLAPDIHGITHTTSRTPPQVARRPDCVADPNLPSDRQSIDAWYDVNAFRLPTTPGVFGSCGRGIIEGPAVRVLHGALYKRFRAERFSFRIGAQATNVLNHPNFSNLSASALQLDNTSGRAKITGAAGATSGSTGDAAGARSMRLELRIDF
jgi:hypothetical protein